MFLALACRKIERTDSRGIYQFKMASDQRKPDGLFVITPKHGPGFVEALPVKKFHGVGPATAERMHRLGIETGADLRARDLAFLQQHFGKSGPHFYWIARGIDEREVKPDRIRKSIGAEDTFREDIHGLEAAHASLQPLIDKVCRYCETHGIRGKTVTLKVKWEDFTQITRSKTAAAPVASAGEIAEIIELLLSPIFPVPKGIRLLGVTLSSLDTADDEVEPQLTFALSSGCRVPVCGIGPSPDSTSMAVRKVTAMLIGGSLL